MIEFNKKSYPDVTDEEMSRIYEKIKTPFKYGSVIKWENDLTDSPSVFKMGDDFYMYFISINKDMGKSGYETHLAKSKDLLHWEYQGCVLKRNELGNWDSKQCGGYAAFIDVYYDGNYELKKVNGSYYISYLGGPSDGYETRPLATGLAKTDDFRKIDSYERLKAPILHPYDEDARKEESETLFKSFLFEDVLGVTGYRYVDIYNAKEKHGPERIMLAVSNDGENWERYGETPVLDMNEIDPNARIAGDPQIICIDDIYVMIYFCFSKGKGAYDTFACSRDLVHWNLWKGEPLIKSTEPWENVYAHKPWFVRHNGVNYHFYCAVNTSGERFIAVATSEPIT